MILSYILSYSLIDLNLIKNNNKQLTNIFRDYILSNHYIGKWETDTWTRRHRCNVCIFNAKINKTKQHYEQKKENESPLQQGTMYKKKNNIYRFHF